MDNYRLKNLSDDELKRKINQLRALIWAAVGLIIALEVFLLATGRSNVLLVVLLFPLTPFILRSNKYYREYRKRKGEL
ncbi:MULTISPECIES: hypothetical protein [Prolixibacter]|uniref:Uncharacterized protein n=1 Tax=Prolixibacter denitrificans TaxID=1541063 RepID=A0A2P8C8M0_9BACT|nr:MULTISPECIES: hypothetical protein [Prolixibacter]PSK81311.1 hypothetical protein CLV93_11095 [Prolixibacter denitrificans]GET21604.1 hypothetical protein JCM18694_18500 [Prolixibacter denitrificans]GET24218.1 hypothetical protein NT017_05470 [Prolixibacter sp. NT017]